MINPMGRTTEIWEFIVNKVGIIEIKFKVKITVNREIRKDAVRFLFERVFTSW